MNDKASLRSQKAKPKRDEERNTQPAENTSCTATAATTSSKSHPHDPIESVDLVIALRQCQKFHIQNASSATSIQNGRKRPNPPLSPHFSGHLLPYPRGMFNSKNYCFMNAVIQALIFIPPVAQLAISVEDAGYREICPTLSTLGKWLREYWKPKVSLLPPSLPLHKQADFSGNIQSDAQEYLQRLLECIDKELVELEETELAADNPEALQQASRAKANDMKGWTVVHHGKQKLTYQVHKTKHSLLLTYLLGGLTESHVSGTVRDRTSVTVESFFSLSLKVGFKSVCTIEEALQYTFQTEKIEVDDAAGGKSIKKSSLLVELPEILILHLSRWAVTAEGEVVKIDNTVTYRSSLTIPASICPDRLANQPKQRMYRLLSVVAHRGNSAHGGHYVTYLSGSSGSVANPFCMTPANSKASGPARHTDPSRPIPGATAGGKGDRNNTNKCSLPPRSPLPNGSFLLCNDVKITLETESTVTKETAYFLVYQKEH